MRNFKVETAALINSVLQYIEQVDSESGETNQVSSIRENLENERRKFLNNQCCVLFAGEIKTGKSSLVNNLINEDICTVNPGVCTNVNTVIKYGSKEQITVFFNEDKKGKIESKHIDRKSISEFVSEKSNKNNKKNVQLIEVELPCECLKNGIYYVDTPGLGSLNPYHAATTFSIVPQADIIVFVSSADSQLTVDEQEYAQKIMSCTRCQAFVHVLTNSDNGDPSTILNTNNEYFKQILADNKIPYYSCAISNTNYERLRNGEAIDIEDTGFDKLLNVIATIQKRSGGFLVQRVLSLCSYIVGQFYSENQILLNSINDPKIAEERKKKLLEIQQRLDNIKEHKEDWNISLSTKICQYKNHIEEIVKSNFNKVKAIVKDKLEEDLYLKSPNKLGSIVSSEIVIQSVAIQKDLEERLLSIYDEIQEESGLNIIQSSLHPTDYSSPECKIDSPIIDKLSIYRKTFYDYTFKYGTVGKAACVAVGGVIGTIVSPGPGTAVGAAIGAAVATAVSAIWGGVMTIVVGRERVLRAKKDKTLTSVNQIINDKQIDYLRNIKDNIAVSEGALKIAFNKAIKEEDKLCKKQTREISEAIAGDTNKRGRCERAIKQLTVLQDKIKDILSTIYEK